MTINDVIDRVREYHRKIDEPMLSGAAEAELARFKKAVVSKWKWNVPKGYLEVLRQVNGFAHDGYGLHATRDIHVDPEDEYPARDGLIEANDGMELDGVAIPGAVCLGYGDDQFFGYDLTTGFYGRYDVYKKLMRTYRSFEEMFHDMFDSRISES